MTTPTKKTPAAQPARPPVAKLRLGLLNASIWQRSTDDGVFYTVSFERRYRDSQGEWHSTQSYSADDLLGLAKLADQAHTAIFQLRAGDAE